MGFVFVIWATKLKFLRILLVVRTSANEQNSHLLFDSAAKCYPDERLYFRTSQVMLPFIQIDFGQPRIVFGITFYLRDDVDSSMHYILAFKKYNLITILSCTDFTSIHISVSPEPGLNDIDLNDLDLCSVVSEANKRVSYRIYVKCTYPLEGRFLNIIKNSNEPSSFSLNEILPHLHGKLQGKRSSS